MSDEKLNQIDQEIEALQARRTHRLAELEDPKRQQVLRLYEELRRIVDELDDLGEDMSNGDGYAISITGTLFGYFNGEITEK